MIYVFLAEGFEETEAIVPVDLMLRAGIDVKTVGASSKTVRGAHGIELTADITADEAVFEGLEGVILPGGMPGTVNLEENSTVIEFLDYAYANGLPIGAICAAPSILGHRGMLNGKKATCYTGFEKDLIGAILIDAPSVTDGSIVTACGAGGAIEFGLALVAILKGENEALELKKSFRYR